jgi:pimeloyl-ACP methyl ester carboxylesterase
VTRQRSGRLRVAGLAGRPDAAAQPGGAAELVVTSVGPPDAPAVVLAHGVGSSARFVVEAFAPAVLARGRRLVTYDQRGHGASSPAPEVGDHHLDVQAADLAAVVAAVLDPRGPLAGDDAGEVWRAPGGVEVVGGVSAGGHAAVRAVGAGLVRPRAVVAVAPAWTGRAVAGEGPHAVMAAEVRRVGVPGLLARVAAATDLPGWLQATVLRDQARHDRASLAAALTALDGGEAPTAAEVSSLDVPLTVVGWPGDPGHPLAVAQAWATLAPRGRLATLRLDDLDAYGVGHLGGVAFAPPPAGSRSG